MLVKAPGVRRVSRLTAGSALDERMVHRRATADPTAPAAERGAVRGVQFA
jgi:hypothetical protein